MRNIHLLIISLFIVSPMFATAQTLADEIALVAKYLNILMPFLITLGLLFFMWGVLQFIRASGNEDEVTEGRNRMIYGIIGLFVMVSVWGLVYLLINTFKLTNTNMPPLPTLGAPGGGSGGDRWGNSTDPGYSTGV